MFLTLALLACGSGDDTDTDTDTDVTDTDVTDTDVTDTDVTTVDSTGVIYPDCGPADGFALRLSLDEGTDPMTCDVMMDAHNITLFLWNNLPSPDALPAVVPLGSDYATGGNANYCTDPNANTPTCEMAVSGQVQFDSFTTEGAASGSYTFTLPSGTVISGTFSADYCPHTMMCG